MLPLAAELLGAAKLAKDAPGLGQLLYEKAYELGVKNKAGYATALAAVESLAKCAPAERQLWRDRKQQVLSLQYRYGYGKARAAAGQAYLELLMEAADGKAGSGQTAREALKLHRDALRVALATKSKRVDEIRHKIKQAEAVRARGGVSRVSSICGSAWWPTFARSSSKPVRRSRSPASKRRGRCSRGWMP